MFENKNEQTEGPGTVVGANVKLVGTLKDTNDITVHGSVDGEVISDKHVTIASSAKVKGPIKAKTVTISGTVNGEISVKESIEILETGNVTGSIETKNLVIKSGANFNGKSMMKINDNKEYKKSDFKKKEEKPKTSSKKEDKKDENDDNNIFKASDDVKYEIE